MHLRWNCNVNSWYICKPNSIRIYIVYEGNLISNRFEKSSVQYLTTHKIIFVFWNAFKWQIISLLSLFSCHPKSCLACLPSNQNKWWKGICGTDDVWQFIFVQCDIHGYEQVCHSTLNIWYIMKKNEYKLGYNF